MSRRGYCGIGIYHTKCAANVGTLWRSAAIYGAQFIFTIGKRYNKQASDTGKAWRQIPLWHFDTFEDFYEHMPYNCPLICVEQAESAHDLRTFAHPERAIYLLGAEDHGLPESILRGNCKLEIPTHLPTCMNVATAGSIVLYDRFVKTTL